MKREFYSQHSDVLNEHMSMIVYGEGGYPVIAFQAQDAKSNNFEDFGMIDVLTPYIEDGRIQVFSVDNLDEESWSDEGGDKAARAARQEDYFRFVTDELLPRVHSWNNSDLRPIAVGCSMGATHAAIAALRRPDLFQGCIALSGVYSTSFFFGDWMDENLYNNDIPAFLTNMPTDHPYVDIYNQRQLVLCVGQGAWEMGLDDLRYIDGQLNRLGVKHWCDFWGYDVNHDWPWWRKQMPYFMNEVLRDIEAQLEAARAAEPQIEAAPEPEVVAEPQAEAAPEVEAAPEPEVEAAPEVVAAPESEVEAVVEPKAEIAVDTAPEVAPEAAAEPEAKPAPKTTRKRTTRKAATPKAETAPEAAEESEAEAAPKTTRKRTTRKATTKTTTRRSAAAKKADEDASAEATTATEPAEPAKTAAKRTTRKRTTAAAKAAAAEQVEAPGTEDTAETAAPKKPAAKRSTTRKTTAAKSTGTKTTTRKTTTRRKAAPKADTTPDAE